MKRIILALVVSAVLVPAAAFAAAPQDASTFCKTNATTLIGTGTGKLYKTMGACVRAQNAQQAQNTTNASAACKAEMADTAFATGHAGKTFAQFYGTGKNATNGNGMPSASASPPRRAPRPQRSSRPRPRQPRRARPTRH